MKHCGYCFKIKFKSRQSKHNFILVISLLTKNLKNYSQCILTKDKNICRTESNRFYSTFLG